MDFLYIIRVLSKRKWLIIASAVLAAAIAYFLTRNEQKWYKSIAQVSTGFTISDEIKVNNENFSFFEAETKFNNAIVTFTSPPVINLLSYTLILHDLNSSTPFRHIPKELKETPLFKQINKEEAKKVYARKLETMSMLNSYKPEEKQLLEFLKLYRYDYKTISSQLNVYRLQRTDYIQIDFFSENPELSAFVVNNCYLQFIRYFRNVRDNKSQESIDTLYSMMEKKKQLLDEKNAVLKGEGLVDAKLESGSNFELISKLEENLAEERKKQTSLFYSLKKINQRIANLKNPGNKSVSSNDEVIILRKAMNDAYTAYVNNGANDKSLLYKYNQLKNEYQSKILSYSNTVDNGNNAGLNSDRSVLLDQRNDVELDIQASTANIKALLGKIGALKGNVTSTASKSAAIETLLKEVEMAETEYLEAKKKYSDALDITTSSVNNFRQILLGQPAIDPEPSKRKLIVGMAGAAALVVSVLVIVFLTFLDSSIKTPNIFFKTVNLQLLCMVNYMNFNNKLIPDVLITKPDETNIKDKKRQNLFRESIRKLRFEIENSGKKTFLFTSTTKGQGKTTLIQALSYSLSLSKKKVLIIDTNFCNNDLTVQLNAEPILENFSFLDTNEKSLIEQVKQASMDIDGGNVHVIGSHGGDYTPSEILPNVNLLHYLDILTKEFDYIFLEGPPLNDFSDSKELSKYVDGVIAVFSANHIIKQIDKESITFYKGLNGKFCGSILNKMEMENINVT